MSKSVLRVACVVTLVGASCSPTSSGRRGGSGGVPSTGGLPDVSTPSCAQTTPAGLRSCVEPDRYEQDLVVFTIPLTADQRTDSLFYPLNARSDHHGFWQNGFPAAMLTDTSEFRYPHGGHET